jgi:alginate O-acetyltransferase complex protein AlgI
MLLSSAHFLVFFTLVTAAYYILPQRLQWLLILAASCYFYMALIPIYILVLFAVILIDYTAAILMETAAPARRRIFLLASLAGNLGFLGFFKYFDFANQNLSAFLSLIHLNYTAPKLGLALPLGLSFHTFQSLSYSLEVYRGHYKAERHLGRLALYVMFYPQLTAGPIERPQGLLDQLKQPRPFDYYMVTTGLRMMALGLFKKVVVADRLALVVNAVFDDPHRYSGVPLAVASLCFSLQIYYDFAGYSDIAIGAARAMNIRLTKNFDRPYSAESIAEFWRRWHITLYTWFRDYLYIPLGGNRVPPIRKYFNLMAVFLVSGLWHGASWPTVTFGGLNGLYVIGSQTTNTIRERLARQIGIARAARFHHAVRVSLTFVLVSFAFIFFRAASLSDALYVATHLVSLPHRGWTFTGNHLLTESLSRSTILAIVPALAGVGWMSLVMSREDPAGRFIEPIERHSWLRWTLYHFWVIYILRFGSFGVRPFIYFQF